ncbi:MAG: CbiX/SirB N-terminal domain-containing protein [Peptostreptococcaceae bacterium]
MVNSTLLFVSLLLSFIFTGYMENIFIVLATLLFYKQIIIDKDYKYMAYGFIIAFIGINITIVSVFRNDIKIKDISPLEPQEETVILLVSEGESKNYNLKERASEIYFEKGFMSYVSSITDLVTYKMYYEEFGSSDFKEDAEYIASSLRERLGSNYKVVNSYLYSTPYFENSIEDIISKGYKNIIICPLFMTEGKDYEIFTKRYEDLNISTYNLNKVEILDTFYKSNNLALLYKEEILNTITTKNKDIGVLLVGFQNENNLEQDILFREKIRDYILQDEKNSYIQIKLPLLENNKKDIIKYGEELLEYGIDGLYIVLPTSIIDGIHTKSLVNDILNELDMGDTKFYYIDANKKYDLIVNEIFSRISLLSEIGGQ